MAAIFFTFSGGTGAVKGDGWDLGYQSFASGAEAWFSVQRDGFVLKPGTDLVVLNNVWTAQVIRP